MHLPPKFWYIILYGQAVCTCIIHIIRASLGPCIKLCLVDILLYICGWLPPTGDEAVGK